MKKILSFILSACVLVAIMAVFSGCGQNELPPVDKQAGKLLDPENPTTITVWNYYTAAQLDAFDAHVAEFNNTKGKELGINVISSSEGSVVNLENNVISAAQKEVGAKDVPNIFAAYSDTAYKIDKMGLVADIKDYFTDKELSEYIDGYLKEGDLNGDGSIKIFPIAKSTEIFMLNITDWNKFAEATGAKLDDLKTIEGVTATAKKYYDWCGKAFFGRDAMANYILIGAMQLGTEIISIDSEGRAVLNFPKETLRKLWDNYYIPYISGHFSSVGRFRSDDVKIGNIIGFVGSSTSVSFFPKQVLLDNADAYDIEHMVLPAPQFAESRDYAIQQGAGLVVTKGTDAEVLASVEFLKWFTDVEQNIKFANASGYLPVKKSANDLETIRQTVGDSFKQNESLEVSLNTVNSNFLYTPTATENGSTVRSILENAMSDKAISDRAEIIKLVEGGMSETEAVAKYVADENFDNWYNTTKSALEANF